MEDNKFSHPDIILILEHFGNNNCVDCQNKKVLWCSVNNGVFLCVKCARNHKKNLKRYSIIKSLEADLFNDFEINLLKKGGNMRFNNLMTEYNIPLSNEMKEYKYQTLIADYYRKLLENEVKGIKIEFKKPSLQDGILKINPEISNNNNVIYNNNQNNNIYNQNNNQQMNYIMNQNINRNINNDISEKREKNINDNNSNYNNWNNVFSSMGEMFNTFIKDYQIDKKIDQANEYINDKKIQIANSELFQSMKIKAENGIQIIKEKASELYNGERYDNEFDHIKSSDIFEMSNENSIKENGKDNNHKNNINNNNN